MTASAHALRDEAALCWLASRGREVPDDPTEAKRLFAEAYRAVGAPVTREQARQFTQETAADQPYAWHLGAVAAASAGRAER